MKIIRLSLVLLCSTVLLLVCRSSFGQSIAITSVSATTFCAGDPISVTFTADGSWGYKNAFTLQLSDANGSFSNTFTNLGSISDTESGIFTIQTGLPQNPSYRVSTDDGMSWENIPAGSARYRLRVIGANPYSASPDNGSDIRINIPPTLTNLKTSPSTVIVSEPVGFSFNSSDLDDTSQVKVTNVLWNFGTDASPATAYDTVRYFGISDTTIIPSDSIGKPADTVVHKNNGNMFTHQSIVYSSMGDKTVIVSALTSTGCVTVDSIHIHVFGCVPVVISHSALVDSADNIPYGLHQNIL